MEVRTIEDNEYCIVFFEPHESINDFVIEFKRNGEIYCDNKAIGEWKREDRYLIVQGNNKEISKEDITFMQFQMIYFGYARVI